MSAAILVTGATGAVGRAALAALRERGVQAAAFTRDPVRARKLLGADVELRAGDLADGGSLGAALQGVQAVLLCSAHGPQMREVQLAAVATMAAAGTRRVVKISGSPVTLAHPARSGSGADHLAVEEALRASVVQAAAVRPNIFMQNFLDQSAAVGHGALPGPDGGPRVSFVDARDAGRVAAAALTAERIEPALEVTGPEALTWFEVAGLMSEVLGREVTHYPAPAELARAGLLALGRPEWLVDHQLEIASLLGDPQAAEVTGTVAALTGAEPVSLREFLAEHAAAFPQAA